MWENKDGKTPEQWDEEMEAENKKKANSGKELWGGGRLKLMLRRRTGRLM